MANPKKKNPRTASSGRQAGADAAAAGLATEIKPIGGYFLDPEGQFTYQYDPSEFGAAAALPYGKGNPLVANLGPGQTRQFALENPAYGFAPSRGPSPSGNLFYAEGDELILSGQIMNKGPEEVARVQQMLEDAGYLKGTYTQGQMDPETVAAFTSALELANYLGTDWEKALSVRKQKMKEAKPKRKMEPLALDLTSPDDIKAMLATGAQQLFGSYVSKDDLDRFVEKTRGQEAEYQTAARLASGYDVAGNPIGATDEEGRPVGQPGAVLPSPPTTAGGINRQFEEQFFAEHPAQAGASVFQTKLGEIISSLHGPNIRIPT